MKDIEEVKEMLKTRLTEKRYNHSLGAMKAAKEIAKIDAKIAAIKYTIKALDPAC